MHTLTVVAAVRAELEGDGHVKSVFAARAPAEAKAEQEAAVVMVMVFVVVDIASLVLLQESVPPCVVLVVRGVGPASAPTVTLTVSVVVATEDGAGQLDVAPVAIPVAEAVVGHAHILRAKRNGALSTVMPVVSVPRMM